MADNRQPLPETVAKLHFPHLNFSPATEAKIAEREKANAAKAATRQATEIGRRGAELISAAGARYRDCTLENYRASEPLQREVVAALRQYCRDDCRDTVILFGPVGTGKDHLAFSLCRAAVKGGRTVRWINGQTWFGMIRDAMDTSTSEASLISDLSKPDLLALSDPLPPVGPLTQHQATMLYRVVDARYSRGVPTICTINVANNDEADSRMGAAIWDRLCHDAWKLCCSWPSFRRPKHEIGGAREAIGPPPARKSLFATNGKH